MNVKLNKVIDTLCFINDGIEYCYNLNNGEVFMSNIGNYENSNEDIL